MCFKNWKVCSNTENAELKLLSLQEETSAWSGRKLVIQDPRNDIVLLGEGSRTPHLAVIDAIDSSGGMIISGWQTEKLWEKHFSRVTSSITEIAWSYTL
jgi:hypothetical protein